MVRPEDAVALERLYLGEAARLFAWVRLMARPKERPHLAVEDITQEIWCRAAEKFHGWNPAHSSFRAWLYTVAKLVMMEAFRGAGRRRRIQIDEGRTEVVRARYQVPDRITTVTGRVARDEAMQALLAEVEALDPTDRRVFVLCGLEDMSAPAAATRVGLSAEAVKKRWQRLRQRLRTVRAARELLGPAVDRGLSAGGQGE